MLRQTLIGLTLVSACAFARPAAAQYQGPLYFTLSNVTFADGAAANGSFTYDFFTYPPGGTASVTTTSGVIDSLPGSSYTSVQSISGEPGFYFLSPTNALMLVFDPGNALTGTFPIQPGVISGTGFSGSVETVEGSNLRAITSGDLIVSATPAAVPEASTTVSFGLLLTLGLGGAVVTARRKKAAA